MYLLILIAAGHCNETLSAVRQVVSGELHACALRTDGSVWCWGDNSACQLRANTPFSPIAIQTPYVNVASLSAFGNITCALMAAGGGVCWGSLHLNMASCADREWVVGAASEFAAVEGGIVALHNGRVTRVTGRSSGRFLPAAIPFCYAVRDYVVCGNLTVQRTKNWYPAGQRVEHQCYTKLDRQGELMRGPGMFTREGVDGSTMCVLIPPCEHRPSAVLPADNLPLTALAAGDFHTCVLDRHHKLFCHGSHDACQFIPVGPKTADWQPAYMPWPTAVALHAAGNLTCVSTANSVFCTGCTHSGCLCRTAATVTSVAAIASLRVTPSSYCVVADTARCEGAPTVTAADRCRIGGGVVACAPESAVVPSALSVVASKNIITIVTHEGMCTSTDNLYTLTCV